MTGGSPQDSGTNPAARPPLGADFFTAPDQVNHRRYEALRAFFIDGLTHAQAAAKFGYAALWTYERLLRPVGDLPQPGGPPRPLTRTSAQRVGGNPFPGLSPG